MILNLPFKSFIGQKEKPVEVIFRLGTLEDTCNDLNVKFKDIRQALTDNDYDFSVKLLFNAYLEGCRRRYEKPKFNLHHAVNWFEYMSTTERKKYVEGLNEMIGRLVSEFKEDDKKKVTE